LFVWRLKQRKKRALKEVLLDIDFLEKAYGDLLATTEDKIKNELFAENKKDKPNEVKIKQLTKKLAKFYSVKKQHEASCELCDDLNRYLNHLG